MKTSLEVVRPWQDGARLALRSCECDISSAQKGDWWMVLMWCLMGARRLLSRIYVEEDDDASEIKPR